MAWVEMTCSVQA